jgi:type II secretory pathway predicted ATPase ExeA
MYTKFFGLAEEPFNLTPDSRFLFLSERHREALATLTYGVRERKGFILLTGEIGSGKTTVCRAFVNELLRSNDVRLALILNPGLSEIELLKAINDEFQIPSFYNSKKGLIDELNRFLLAQNQKGNNVVLIIDEAQTLSPALLEQIRMLSNLETEIEKLLQIVLIGQPELRDTLALSQLEQLNQRIAVRYHLTPLTESEVLAYIKHRLFVARATVAIEFTPEALRRLYDASRGIPRRINVICDRALLACYAEATTVVDDKIMQRAIEEVTRGGELPSESGLKRVSSRSLPRIDPEVAKKAGRKLALWLGIGSGATLALAVAIAIGIKLANVRASQNIDYAPRVTPAPSTDSLPKAGQPLNLKQQQSASDSDFVATATEVTTATPAVTKAAPTPTPDWETLRRKNPHWKYEKNAPLVRVNNPKAALRAAQFSLLKMWGFPVDLSEMSKLGDDQIINGVLQSDNVKIREIRLPGSFYDVVKLNVPVIVRIKDPSPEHSEYMVLLRAEGEAVTVGDPVWGVKNFRAKDFIKRFDSASAVYVDVHQLTSIQRGEASERVRALQEYLAKRGYLTNVSGKFDVDTAEAIKRFQAYYKLRETGQIDDLTAMLLNSRMMENGPRLAATGD